MTFFKIKIPSNLKNTVKANSPFPLALPPPSLYWTLCPYSRHFPWGKYGSLKWLTASVGYPAYRYLCRSFVKAFTWETVFQQDKLDQEEKENCIQTLLFWEGQPNSLQKLDVQPHWSRRKVVVFEIAYECGDGTVLEVDWCVLFRNGSWHC